MAQTLPRRPSAFSGGTGLVLIGLLGAGAAAWLWSRRDEDALRQRTADRLRPPGGRTAA